MMRHQELKRIASWKPMDKPFSLLLCSQASCCFLGSFILSLNIPLGNLIASLFFRIEEFYSSLKSMTFWGVFVTCILRLYLKLMIDVF